ncbi:MAG: hypothetical protein JXC32_12470 [Anaerolineae bacterium]|nr:hypothetical protein [Anaerolineae bacterium]
MSEWRQREVVEAVKAYVTDGMETAAKVIEEDARKNLLRVREPEFGVGYRRVLALYRLTSLVKAAGMVIEAQIGIPRGEKGGDYGFWIETGSKTAGAHPWLRPALAKNLRNIVGLLGR